MKALKGLYFGAGFIVLAGLLELSSINMQNFYQQLMWVVLGLLVFFAFSYFDWQVIFQSQWFVRIFYFGSIGLLLLTYFTAPEIRNTRSWLVFGPFRFQPVEMAKVALILFYAMYFSRKHLSIARLSNVIISFLILVPLAGAVFMLPDYGSMLVLIFIWIGFILVSGLPKKWIITGVAMFLILSPLVWAYGLKPYHRARIMGVINPEQNALGVNYSAIQAKIAIGSAGLWGKGYHQGPQTQLGFVTEPETDFIFPAFVEEWGIIPGLLLIVAFITMNISILRIGLYSSQNKAKFICLGTSIVFSAHFLLNIGMVTGLTPVVGVPFPFLSYGGSNILMSFFLISIVNAIGRRA